MPEEAFRVHGHSSEALAVQPIFADIAPDFLAFLGEDPLVIHNAEFDIKFINAELAWLGIPPIAPSRVVDTLAIARRRHPGAPNSARRLVRPLPDRSHAAYKARRAARRRDSGRSLRRIARRAAEVAGFRSPWGGKPRRSPSRRAIGRAHQDYWAADYCGRARSACQLYRDAWRAGDLAALFGRARTSRSCARSSWVIARFQRPTDSERKRSARTLTLGGRVSRVRALFLNLRRDVHRSLA